MPKFAIDKSGTMVSDVFYELCDDISKVLTEVPDSYIASLGDYRGGTEFAEAEVVDLQMTDEFTCSRSKTHRTGRKVKACSVELRFGAVAPFVICFGAVIASRSLGERLREAKFGGLALVDVEVQAGDWRTDEKTICLLDYRGANVCRRRKFIPSDSNKCPFCGKGPIICPECEEILAPRCSQCGEKLFTIEGDWKGESDPRLYLVPTPAEGDVVDASRWDGSDFVRSGIGGWAVTKRVIDFLLRVHAFPFVARPLRTWIDNCSQGQLKRLEAAKKYQDS